MNRPTFSIALLLTTGALVSIAVAALVPGPGSPVQWSVLGIAGLASLLVVILLRAIRFGASGVYHVLGAVSDVALLSSRRFRVIRVALLGLAALGTLAFGAHIIWRQTSRRRPDNDPRANVAIQSIPDTRSAFDPREDANPNSQRAPRIEWGMKADELEFYRRMSDQFEAVRER
jgi:hypothetical protein